MEENQEKSCWNTKRIKKGSTGQTYEGKDWSTRPCEEAQRTCPTTLILVIESITITMYRHISKISITIHYCTITVKMHINTITCQLGCGNREDIVLD